MKTIESPHHAANAVYDEICQPGEGWLHPLRKGQTLRIVDMEGNQAVDTLFYNLHDPEERYSATTTIKKQGNVYLGAGSQLYSDEGNLMLSISADTCGRHDTVGGACSPESNTVRYALEKRPMHACRDTFLSCIAHAHNDVPPLTKRDITHNINFFMNVPITPEGGLKFEDGISSPGKYVEVTAHMDVAVLISNCPQLNNPCNAYNPTPIRLLIWD